MDEEAEAGSSVMMDMEKDKYEDMRKLKAFMAYKFGEEWVNFIPPPEEIPEPEPEKIKKIIDIYSQPRRNVSAPLKNSLEFYRVPTGLYKGCFITHKISPVEFYVQVPKLNNIGLKLTRAIEDFIEEGKLTLFKKPKEGDLCLAPFEDNDENNANKMILFRGEIVKIRRGYLKLFFLDFGGVARVFPTTIYHMPDELKKFPKLALRAQWAMLLCDEIDEDEKMKEYNLMERGEYHDMYFNGEITDGEYLVDFGRFKSSDFAEFIIHDEIKKYYDEEDPALSVVDAESTYTSQAQDQSQLMEIRRAPNKKFSTAPVTSVKENVQEAKPINKTESNIVPVPAQIKAREVIPVKNMENKSVPTQLKVCEVVPKALPVKNMENKSMPTQLKACETVPEARPVKKVENKPVPTQLKEVVPAEALPKKKLVANNSVPVQVNIREVIPEAIPFQKMDKKATLVKVKTQEVAKEAKDTSKEMMDVRGRDKANVRGSDKRDVLAPVPTVPAELIKEKAQVPKKLVVWNADNVSFTKKIVDGSKVKVLFAWNPLKLLTISAEDEGVILGELQPLITEYVKSGNSIKLDRMPEKGEYLLAEYLDEYYRGYVIKACGEKKKVKMEFVDFGDSLTVKFNKVFIPTAEIMKYPIYGKVFGLRNIDDVPEGYKLSENISRHFDSEEFTIKLFENDKVTLGCDNFLINDLVSADIYAYKKKMKKGGVKNQQHQAQNDETQSTSNMSSPRPSKY